MSKLATENPECCLSVLTTGAEAPALAVAVDVDAAGFISEAVLICSCVE